MRVERTGGRSPAGWSGTPPETLGATLFPRGLNFLPASACLLDLETRLTTGRAKAHPECQSIRPHAVSNCWGLYFWKRKKELANMNSPTLVQRIERWLLDRVLPFANNARTHSDAQIAQIAASIAEFGFVNPILVGSDNLIIAGHARALAARQLGLTEVPVIVLDHLTATQRRALVIADNQLALGAGWDPAPRANSLSGVNYCSERHRKRLPISAHKQVRLERTPRESEAARISFLLPDF